MALRLAVGRDLSLEGIWRWWLGELSALLPAPLRRLFGGDRDLLLIAAAGDSLRCRLVRSGRPHDIAPTASREQLATLARDATVVLRLAPEMGLEKVLTLPLAAEESLAEVLAFEIERQTPFRTEQVHLRHKIIERRPSEKALLLRLTVVPRQRLAAVLAAVHALGLEPAIVDVGEGDHAPERGANLLAGAAATGTGSALRQVAVAVLVLAAILAAPVVRFDWAVSARQAEIDALRPQVEQALALRRQVERRQGMAAEVAAAKAAAPSAALLLEDLSRRFPDDTWVTQFNLHDGGLEVQGTAASAAALVPLIEASPLFGRVTFRTPIVRDPLTGKEQFQLLIALARRP